MATLNQISIKTNSKGTYTNLINLIYPVGAVYLAANDTSPATIFGGTWTEIGAGHHIVSAGTSYTRGATGGSNSVTLAVGNLPAHNHSVSSSGAHTHSTNETGGHSHTFKIYWGKDWLPNTANESYSCASSPQNNYTTTTSTTGAHSHSIASSGAHTHTTNNTGSGAAFSKAPAYVAFRIWKRTA